MKYLTGDIFIYKKSTDIYSRLIKWYTGDTYSHSGVILKWIDDTTAIVCESLAEGFVIHEQYIPYLESVADIGRVQKKMTKHERIYLRELAYAMEGRSYDWVSIFILMLRKYKISIPYINTNKLICSEATEMLIYYAFGIRLEPTKYFEQVTPQDQSKSKKITWVHKC